MNRLRRVVYWLGLGRPARQASRVLRALARLAGRATAAIARAFARIADVPAGRRWQRAIHAELDAPRQPDVILGKPDPDAQLVVVCLWNRPERVEEVLRIAASQDHVGPIRLILWNNNASDSTRNRSHLVPERVRGSLASIEYIDSPHNLMGMARFVAVRNAVLAGHKGGSFITLDDDEDVPTDFFAALAGHSGPTVVAGWWACLIHGTYWERTELVEDGAAANYVGTGGAIWPVYLVDDPHLIEGIPTRFRMIEDLWASALALRKGWTLVKVAANVDFVYRHRDQGHALHELKTEFYERLR